MNEDAYLGKKVIITGADGFIGSHLTERLVDAGAEVSILIKDYARVPGTNERSLHNLNHLRDRINIICGDISSSDTTDLIKREKANIIFHLAAEAYVNKSFLQPREVIRTNVEGTLNILHAGLDEEKKRVKGLERIVCTSSSEVYGTHNLPITEDFPMNPSSPYGASKAAADRIAFSYFYTFNLPVAIIRPFNTYGPRHTYDAPPKFISLALQGKDITIYGEGTQMRDLMYVDDVVDAFLIMGSQKEAIGQAVNFGTGKDTKIIDLAKEIVRISGSTSQITHLPERQAEVQRLCCNPTKARELFGWEAKIDLGEGLRRNIEWARNTKNVT